MSVLTIESVEQFEQLKKDSTIVVDFYADWCGPCKMIAPIYEDVSSEPSFSNVTFAKLNVDTFPDIPKQIGIRGIPNILVFRNGEVVGAKVGAITKAALLTFLTETI